ncbi:MAG: hypothetical protein AB8B72_03655 [Crocinitomicaceae bacterium]
MKKVKYGALFLAIVGIGLASCEKEEIGGIQNESTDSNSTPALKSGSVGIEITFMPASESEADNLVQNVLDNTTAGNPDFTAYANSEADPLVEEGVWMMEAAANYLTNVNFETTSADETHQFNISVDNYVDGGIIKMNDADLYAKFDAFMVSVNSYANESERLPRLVDFKVVNVSNSLTTLQAYVVYGEDILPSVTFPTTNGDIYTVRDELESKITQTIYGQLFQQYVGNAASGSYSVTGNPYFANVNVLTQTIAYYPSYQLASFGCVDEFGVASDDCLWDDDIAGIHQVIISNVNGGGYFFPATEYPKYYQRGKDLVLNNFSTITPLPGAFGAFGCNYEVDAIGVINFHRIIEIYTGVMHTM